MADSSANWQRARSPEQIAERRADILQAAGTLIDEGGLEKAGLNAIARQVGLSKANLYRYFESREAILLDLLLDNLRDYCHLVNQDLAGMAKASRKCSVESVAQVFAKRHAEHPRLGLLMHALPGIIEHNISLDTAIDFKRVAFELFGELVDGLSHVLPALSSSGAMQFLWLWSISICGAWPHSHPHPVITKAMEHLGMESMLQSYQDTIYSLATAILHEQLNQS